MPFTAITKPPQGRATWKSIIDAVIDNLAYLFNRQSADVTVSNGSFEIDANADGYPDNWTFTQYPSGSFLRDNTDQRHGLYSAKFTSPGGASNGGGYLHSDDFIPVSPNRQVEVLFELKSSVAGVSNRVEIFWYKSDQTASATTSTTLYTSITNPTTWTAFSGVTTPPADARYAKVRITGCHTASTTAGSTWFDNVQFRLRQAIIPTMEIITASVTWTCPDRVTRVRIRAWGGGAGGGSGAGAGGGGGAGGYVDGSYDVTPGTGYVVTIGAGGAATANGNNTTFGGLVTANGGAATGGTAGGAGGGGSGTGAPLIITGQIGYPTSMKSFGGSAACGGFGGQENAAGLSPGGGGGGSSTGVGGAAGAAGKVVLDY